jgi:hypothetical protein
MRKIFLILIVIFAHPTNSKSQNSIETEYLICIKALDFIKAKDIEGLKGLIHKGSFKNTTDEKFAKGVNELYDLVVGVENPTMDMVLVMSSTSQYDGQNANIYTLGFPFLPMSRRDDERGVQLVFMFSKEIKKNKIVGWKIRDFQAPLDGRVEDDKKNIPQLDRFDFHSKNIEWLKVIYKKSESVENFFTLAGDSATIKKLNIEGKLEEVFTLINNAKIEKKDYNTSSINTVPDLELYILQVDFSNYSLKKYQDFEIALVLTDDYTRKEEYEGYLVVRHNGAFRYFINTNDNPTIVSKLKELTGMIFK